MRENQDLVSDEEEELVPEEEIRRDPVPCDKPSEAIRFGTLFIRGLIKARVSSGRNPDPTTG
jgi:hypothetical protein